PRASRTVPFVSKATGIQLAKLATKVMLGKSLDELGFTEEVIPEYYSVKEAVLPFDRFSNVDTLLGPEMKSTGEVMGIDKDLGLALAKAHLGGGHKLPAEGGVFISVRDEDKESVLELAQDYYNAGFNILATIGTSRYLNENSVPNTMIRKISVGRPNVIDEIKTNNISVIVNTGGSDAYEKKDGYQIRRSALKYKVPYATTVPGAVAMLRGIEALKKGSLKVKSVQEYHE
ncbi:MAG: carbamoyl phosphate synthase large subunit, partial [Deltaproteobacteria bacterium]|nr:carbamoyl phosphate synthase large subunit [Deltaproteobacteria bacterium]